MIRTYSELRGFRTLEERFDYLRLGGLVGASTFGFDRWINQQFYRSREWKQVRNHIIARDEGMDLGSDDTPILGAHLIHHMNPLTLDDFEEGSDNLLDPEFLITTALRTHNAIHFGDASLLPKPYVERRPGDTKLW
jgi:hypothetical protein